MGGGWWSSGGIELDHSVFGRRYVGRWSIDQSIVLSSSRLSA